MNVTEQSMGLLDGLQWVYLECREGRKRRFYRIVSYPGLFGPTLIRDWGRIGSMGRTKTSVFEDEKEQTQAWSQILERREKPGYHCVAAG